MAQWFMDDFGLTNDSDDLYDGLVAARRQIERLKGDVGELEDEIKSLRLQLKFVKERAESLEDFVMPKLKVFMDHLFPPRGTIPEDIAEAAKKFWQGLKDENHL